MISNNPKFEAQKLQISDYFSVLRDIGLTAAVGGTLLLTSLPSKGFVISDLTLANKLKHLGSITVLLVTFI